MMTMLLMKRKRQRTCLRFLKRERKSMPKLGGSLGVGIKSCTCNVHKPIPINSHITK